MRRSFLFGGKNVGADAGGRHRGDDVPGGQRERDSAPALYRRFGFVPAELFFELDYPVQRFMLHRS